MARILDTTGKAQANPPMVVVSKGFESLLFKTNVSYDAIANEKIAIKIQRKSGNIDAFEGGTIELKRFIQMCSTGQGAISYDSAGMLSIVFDLTPGGNIPLFQNEEIQITMTGLDSTKSYQLSTLESPYDAVEMYQYSKKILNAATLKDDFIVTDCDVCLLEYSADVGEVRLDYADPRFKQTVHTLEELESVYRQADPISQITAAGVVKSTFVDYVVVVTTGVKRLEINKIEGNLYRVYLRTIID